MKIDQFNLFELNRENFRFECIQIKYDRFWYSNIFAIRIYSIFTNIFESNMRPIRIYLNRIWSLFEFIRIC